MSLRRERTVSFIVWGPILRSDIPGLTARVCGLLERSAAGVALCEVRNVVVPDAVTVEALARLQLGAQRHRCRVILLHASEELLELVALMGLSDVIAG